MCNTGGRIHMWIGIVLIPIRLRIWISIKVEIRIRISNYNRSPNSHHLTVTPPMGSGSGLWAVKAFITKKYSLFERCSESNPNSTGPVGRGPSRQNLPRKKERSEEILKVLTIEKRGGLIGVFFDGSHFKPRWNFKTNPYCLHLMRGLKLLSEPTFYYLKTIIFPKSSTVSEV